MKLIRKLHKWLGLIAGLQLVLWLISGLVMSALDDDVVSGADSAAMERDPEPLPEDPRLIEPESLLKMSEAPVVEIELRRLRDQWVWRVSTASGVQLFDALDGERIEIDSVQAQQLAAAQYAGPGAASTAVLLQAPTLEARDHRGPIWRVDFNDQQHTRYYVSPQDGEIVTRRTDAWRVFDFFWMLHTMDYRGRDDFNHPLVIVFAFLSVWLAVSGALLLPQALKRTR